MVGGSAYTDAEIRTQLETNEIGGGSAYVDRLPDSRIWTEAECDVTVSTRSQLETELGRSGDRKIWISNGKWIDTSGMSVSVTGDKVLASNRGQDGAPGPLLYNNTKGNGSKSYDMSSGTPNGIIQLDGSVEVFGIRFRGWAHNYWDSVHHPGYMPYKIDYDKYHQRMFSIRNSGVEVHNCEVYGFPTQAFVIGTKSSGYNPDIHHCDIHDNMMTSAGYGVDVKNGRPTVRYCYINACRHGVNGFGPYDCGWLVEHCLFGPSWSQHVVDMHSLSNNSQGSSNSYSNRSYYGNAGGRMVCRYNTFVSTHIIEDANFQAGKMTRAVGIRGVPWPRTSPGIEIYNNRFEHGFSVGPRPYPGHQLSGRDYGGAITQQWARTRSPTFDFSSRIGKNDLTPNFIVGDNQTNGSTSAYDPVYGAPINLDGEDPQSPGEPVPDPADIKLSTYAEDETPIQGVTVTLFEDTDAA